MAQRLWYRTGMDGLVWVAPLVFDIKDVEDVSCEGGPGVGSGDG